VQLPVSFESSVFVTDALAPELVRHDVAADGTLVEAGRLSFASAGLDLITGWPVSIASASKAYLFDLPSMRAIVWDPARRRVDHGGRGSKTPLVPFELPGWVEVFTRLSPLE